MHKSSMSLERTYPSLTPFQGSVPVTIKAVQGLDVSVHEIPQNLNASPTRMGQIQEETAKDTTLSALREVIMGGWPEKKSDCPSHLWAHWNYRDELTVADVSSSLNR